MSPLTGAAVIPKGQERTSAGEGVEKRNLGTLVVKVLTGIVIMENDIEIPQENFN